MPQINLQFEIAGLPELNNNLDKIAVVVATPIAREALQAGGAVIKAEAEREVHRLTGALAADIIVVTRVSEGSMASDRISKPGEKYVLIGPAWNPDNYRRVATRRRAESREAAPDQTTNPGVYGYFLEVGHRAPGQGLANNAQYQRDARHARRQGKRVDTSKYGHLSTPPYPWLGPSFEATKDIAVERVADVIMRRLDALHIAY
jgi:hypothetical protein